MIKALLLGAGLSDPVAEAISHSQPVKDTEEAVKRKVRRKATKYQRRFGQELKKLKRKFPRTKVGTLMKRAHRATKKALN